ncbi:C39 family peptidase [Sphingomonas hankyongi]|uniref:C39 family peptidase n=1 Tax=Sphingomonas hankyongi TaxID=2908209 RepID=A0ABT0S285_9SPHN|nr:C39 family peptidase [Sphingomonas hankyongi]MCL6729967.1 C39 family peptidase [Sphingomonas hankyongi]
MHRALPAIAFLMTTAAAGAQPSGKAPIWFGPTSSGSHLIVSKPVRSWKDMQFDGLVRQRTDFSCGAAALATIFNAGYGKHTTEAQVLVNMLKISDPEVVKEKGFSLLDMKRYVAEVGMAGEGFQVDFDALRQLKVPGVVLLNIRGYNHFAVIRKAGDDYVQLGDPALGNRVMSRKSFETAWNKVVFVVVGEGYDPSSALANPPPPLSARRLFEERSPTWAADLTDFGLSTVNSFRF